MTASLGIRVLRSSLADWRPMKKECRHARHNALLTATEYVPISADMYSTSTENVFANKHRCKPPESAWKAEAWALQEIEPTPLLPPPPAPMSVIHAGVGGGMWQHQIEKHEGDFAALLARQGSSLWTLHTGQIRIKVFRIRIQVLAYNSFEVLIHITQLNLCSTSK